MHFGVAWPPELEVTLLVSPSQASAKLGWRELCQAAIREEDPKKSLALIAELSRILEEEESRLVRALWERSTE